MNLNVKQTAIARLIVTAIVFGNMLAVTVFGWKPLPYTEDEVYQGISVFLTIATTLWVYFKDNAITSYGKAKHEAGVDAVGTRKEFNEAKVQDNEEEDKAPVDTTEVK